MASTFWVESVEAAVIVVAACGASFGVAVWVPFSLIGEAIAFYGSGGGDGGVSFAKLGGSGSIHSSSSSSSSTSTIAVEDEYSIFISNNGNGIDDDNDEEDDDDLLISQHANLYGNPRSSFPTIEAGTVLGIHNIAIVLPQFAGTLVCSLVFSMVGWFQQVNGYSEKQADAFG